MSERLKIIEGIVATHGGCELCNYTSRYSSPQCDVYEVWIDGELKLRLCNNHLEALRRQLIAVAGKLPRKRTA